MFVQLSLPVERVHTSPMPNDASEPRVSALDLFLTFSRITLSSFGGALFWSRRALVEQHGWLTEQEFVEMVSLAQLLPGGNGVNLAVLVGHRFAGWRGAAASIAGFLGAPCLVIAALAFLHHRYGELPLVHASLTGMSAVAVGLLLAMAARMLVVLRRSVAPWTFVALTFIGVGVMRWPFLAVVGVLAPFAIAAAWKDKL
ncbi:MAG: chromate transporter [Betaproteobacteria bacterium]|nr:MAG: chromate transporter [Betaproteobacteria bacterium]